MRRFVLAFLFLAASTLAMETSSCKTINCSATRAASGGACVTVSGSTVTLNACPDGNYMCSSLSQFRETSDHESGTCYSYTPDSDTPSCPSSHNGQKSTYEYCCVNGDCASNNCDTTNKECIGLAEGVACTSTDQCEADLYCSGDTSGTCVQTKSDGDTCTYDYQCGAGSGCYGICIPYWSLDDGTATTDDRFCKSGAMKNYKCDSVSISIGSNVLSEPFKCTIGQTCSYTWSQSGSQAMESQSCQCDGTGSTTGYCPIGDTWIITDFSDDFYKKFQYDSSDCVGDNAHVTSLGDLDTLVACNSIDQDGYDYYSNMYVIFQSWSLYSSGQIDDCAVDMGLFDPSEDYGSWDSAELLVLSGLLILFN